jgi:hypothetical protein
MKKNNTFEGVQWFLLSSQNHPKVLLSILLNDVAEDLYEVVLVFDGVGFHPLETTQVMPKVHYPL